MWLWQRTPGAHASHMTHKPFPRSSPIHPDPPPSKRWRDISRNRRNLTLRMMKNRLKHEHKTTTTSALRGYLTIRTQRRPKTRKFDVSQAIPGVVCFAKSSANVKRNQGDTSNCRRALDKAVVTPRAANPRLFLYCLLPFGRFTKKISATVVEYWREKRQLETRQHKTDNICNRRRWFQNRKKPTDWLSTCLGLSPQQKGEPRSNHSLSPPLHLLKYILFIANVSP